MPAERVPISEVMVDQRFANNCDTRRALMVLRAEVATCHERSPQRLKKMRRYDIQVNIPLCSLRRATTVHQHASGAKERASSPRQWRVNRKACRTNSPQRADPLNQLPVKL